MAKLLETLIGITLPSADDIIEQRLQKVTENENDVMDTLPNLALAQIKVTLFRDNNCSIILDIEEGASTKEEASAIARMLYQLNEGGMKTTIASIILRQTTGNINDTDFGKSIISAWENQYKEQDEDSIPPSRVLERGA